MIKIVVYSLLLFFTLGLSSCKNSNKLKSINLKDENVISQKRYHGKVVEIDYLEKQLKIYSPTSEKNIRFNFSEKTEVKMDNKILSSDSLKAGQFISIIEEKKGTKIIGLKINIFPGETKP